MPATLDEILDSPATHRPIIMGILNVTPDRFSDGGEFFDPAAAIDRAQRLVEQGADILDVGAESTRPQSQRVEAAEQIRRLEMILPVVTRLGVVVSIDTSLSDVAEFALEAGATVLNDVSAGLDDDQLLPLAARRNAAVILMHMKGQPQTMQQEARYADVVGEVRQFLSDRLAAAVAAGIPRRNVLLDPGIGFGKTLSHNLSLLAHMDAMAHLGQPLVVGVSRKRFIGDLTGQPDPHRRVAGTLAACLEAWRRGATGFRVHDVQDARNAFTVAQAIGRA